MALQRALLCDLLRLCPFAGPDVLYSVQLQNIGSVTLRDMVVMLNAALPQQFACQVADQGIQASDLLFCTATYTASQEDIERGVIATNISFSAVGDPVNASTAYESTLQLPAVTITAVRSMALRVNPGSWSQPIQTRE